MSNPCKAELFNIDASLDDLTHAIFKEKEHNLNHNKPFNNPKLDDLINKRLKIEGLELLSMIPDNTIKACFFDPQYRGILDKMNYGNEGKTREQRRAGLEQMTEKTIVDFINQINRVLMPSAHLFLWIDKFHLCQGVQEWFIKTALSTVDLIVWEKTRIGMGYRTRNKCEFLLVLQKKPIKVKNVWTVHNIPNVIEEGVTNKEHPHSKPINIQTRLIEAISSEGDIILDPAMGSGSVLTACMHSGRNFIGGDING
jgi:site-specific DNA-methyltransferase (adenine-specific)